MNGMKTMLLLTAPFIVPTQVSHLFSTHPATESRIAALEVITVEMGAASAPTAPRP